MIGQCSKFRMTRICRGFKAILVGSICEQKNTNLLPPERKFFQILLAKRWPNLNFYCFAQVSLIETPPVWVPQIDCHLHVQLLKDSRIFARIHFLLRVASKHCFKIRFDNSIGRHQSILPLYFMGPEDVPLFWKKSTLWNPKLCENCPGWTVHVADS